MRMAGVERIEDWRGEQVIDADGEQLGKVEEIFFEAGSGEPLLLSIRSGLLGRKLRLAPLAGATLGKSHVRLAANKEQFERAPEIPGDRPLDGEVLAAVESAYEITLPEQLELWSATELDAYRAEAEQARRRADELEAHAKELIAERDAARQRLAAVTEEAEAADRAAEQARQEAVEARRVADGYEQR
jgi:sporulation protein YlmC with PRC-barrel domain